MEKVDLKRNLKTLYQPAPGKFCFIEVPQMQFLMIDGHGDPNVEPDYQTVVNALYTIAYTLKFAVKKSRGIDYGVLPLEGLWWVDDGTAFSLLDKERWNWTMMIMQPEWVTAALVEESRAAVAGKIDTAMLDRLRFQVYDEGLSVQTLYLGPYADEGPVIRQMHAFIVEHGHVAGGKHHEIYLSDPRRTAPDKLKTIIRQPVQKPPI